nr:VWA domain-containing protein [Acidovorax sp. SRB_14]
MTDAARHATIYARALWRRHRPPSPGPQPLLLGDVAQRLDLLVTAVFGRSFVLRVAQVPAPPSWLARLLLRYPLPPPQALPVPATDGQSLWLPAALDTAGGAAAALQRFRVLALQQAVRAARGSALHAPVAARWPLQHALYHLFEAHAADDALVRLLPGMAPALAQLRRDALGLRPRTTAFAAPVQPFEHLVRLLLQAAPGETPGSGPPPAAHAAPGALPPLALPATPAQVLAHAQALCAAFETPETARARGMQWLWCDPWTGELRPAMGAGAAAGGGAQEGEDGADDGPTRPRSARLARRPEVRPEVDGEDDAGPGIWMVQTAQPHEQAEDPMGLQRPTDRDAQTAAEDFADALSELPEARLVSAPGKPKEVLLSDDPPESQARQAPAASADAGAAERLHYPEWDWRSAAYRHPGATVLLLPAALGPQQWVDDTLAQRRSMLHEIRRRFELLRAQRTRVRRQLDGDEIDLQAYLESHADFCAGLPRDQRLYQSERRSRRDMAITLLVDVSGSTDGWIAYDRRVIDVEREALLLVCIALEGMAEPYSVLAFSGEGPQGVVLRSIKRFTERYDNSVAQRIAGLEPEHYTRAGAAIRHASSLLLHQSAEHRLLLLLSDGKPNDVDDYEGRYGVEDMRQAITEAKLQGISPFCLTIDRQGASYLPAVFGPQHYALLPRPELLPTVLLDWLRRLVAH